MKPKVFIGSSREGLPIANAIHTNLTREAECTVWANGVFQLSATTLTDLIRVLRESDFGVFVFSPDDLTVMRNQMNDTVRDNVIFELGLFIGRLGAERCFFLVPEDSSDLRLPSDLAGITPGVYESGRSDGNWMAALNPACMQISLQMARQKTFQDALSSAATVTPPAKRAPTPKPPPPKKASRAKASPAKITVEKYKAAYLIKGDTKPVKEDLKAFGARWNQSLSGWIIPPAKLEDLRALIPGVELIAED